ncbi:MAG: Ig domain-containing protein [Nitrospira sp.]|nr:Ig domain-containing protein [Nitrospira sp.]
MSTTAGSTASGADGSFTVPAPVNDRAVIHVEASGFAEAFPVARVVSGQTTTVGVKLLPVGSTQPVTVASGGTVTVPNSTAQVDLPANGLVPQNGGTVAGTVNVSVTPINPAVDPKLMPGDFTGLSAGGTTPIESFGAIVVDIRDNAGNRYNLAAGKTATIRIPLGTKSSNPPTTIPLWYFDETSGLWKEEGTATLQGTAPNQYYEGTVSHFSTWNADDPMLRTWVNGCVQDANGQRVAYAWVESDGIDYSGGDSDWTMADGTFKVGVRKGGSSAVRVVKYNSNPFSFEVISNSVTVTSSPNDPTDFVRTLQNCLVVNPGVLTVATSVLAGGNVNAVYNQTLAATGGVPGYAWSLNAGSNPLPAGLSLNASGVILGTPTAAGTTTITVKVTDSVGGIATKQLSITISPAGVMPISITTASPLPAGVVGSTYNLSLAATGGTGTRTWSVTAGSLPTGLTLNPSTGAISGIPTTQGTATFTVQVADSGNPQQSDQRQLSLTINSVGGGGGGTLTVTGAPASVGGSFVVNPSDIVIEDFFGFRGVVWGEVVSGGHIEGVGVVYELSTGNLVSSSFFISDGGVYKQWSCFTPLGSPLPGWTPCSGVTLDVSTGTVTFANATLGDIENLVPTITLNGSLSVTP